MPVKDIQLDCGHPVKIAFDDLNGHEVASAVNHEAAPAKTRCVMNRHSGNEISRRVGLYQLSKALETTQGSDYRSRMEVRTRSRDFKRVRLVFIDRLNGFSRAVDTYNQCAGHPSRWRSWRNRNASLRLE